MFPYAQKAAQLTTTPFISKPTPSGDGNPAPAGASSPAEEMERLYALHSLGILDTPPEPEFDDIVQLAAMICGSPVSIMQLVDKHRQWSKAVFGTSPQETPRDISFCHYAIQQTDVMMVEDATQDPRFQKSPLVVQAGWRFYAGTPVKSPDGHAVGTLCVLDRTPRSLTTEQRSALKVLANQVNARLALRSQQHALKQALKTAQAAKDRAESLERRFHAFMDSGPFLAYMKDVDGRILYYNEAMARTFLVSRQDLLNKTDLELWPAEIAENYRRNDLEVLRNGSLQVRDESNPGRNGTVSTWRSYKFPCIDASGQQLLCGISLDVTEQLRREEQLRQSQAELEAANAMLRELASVDPLTGLVNRRSFDEALRLAFRRRRKANAPLSVLMLDVDHFKLHNDRFGHTHGDTVLRELARCLQSSLRAGDVIARYGGEEFVILLPDVGESQALTLARRVLRAIRAHNWPLAPVTVSIGVSTAVNGSHRAQDLVNFADKAMYQAKCAGRDRCAAFTREP